MEYHFNKFNIASMIAIAIIGFFLQVLMQINHYPVFFIPDLMIFLFAIWVILNIKQDISINILISFLLLIYFYCFSPPKMDIEFNNNYLVSLKPFIYIIILSLCSSAYCNFNIKKFSRAFIYIYPTYLIFTILYRYFLYDQFEPRPNFLFENNFEIPFLLSCFIALVFIYKEKAFGCFLLISLSVFLTGSRSGLIAYLVIALAYLVSLPRRVLFAGLAVISMVVSYILMIRGIPALNVSSIDRVQTFSGLFAFYDFSVLEVLMHPLGFGIYQKVPPSVCAPLEPFAEWVTGNFYNCDPIMLQSFFTRGLYQYGLYVLLYIPVAYYWEVQKRVGWYLAFIILTPIFCASLSVGGLSNGLAFAGVVLCLLAYRQCRR